MQNKIAPVLSIVIAVHNQTERLPSLFDSILRQSCKALEVVVVDDASTQGGLEDVVSAYRSKGLDICFHAASRRYFTKDARLKGVELAQGEIIAFADADDEFLGEDILEHHVQLWLTRDCDVLHFRTMRVHGRGGARAYNAWADRFALELRGEVVFEEYSKTLAGHVMWNKLYSRRLWLEHMEAARAIPITVCSEDLFLSTFYLFHAKHYVGSDLTGYAHEYEDKISVKSACRAAAFFIMIQELLPYLEMRGCSPTALENVTRYLHKGCQSYTNRACLEAVGSDSPARHGDSKVFAGIPPARLLEMLLFANGRNARQLHRAARDFS